ncbi:MAG: ABC transporter ATP-binding protein [Deltaproteobacteria bacterium]|nr:MAG: ABC transporter ATP-binding protein [Deltaproteobacteria bacterium]
MIQLRDVRYRYPSTDWVLNGLDLTVDGGEYIFIGGANGSGKSTLTYLFNGLVPHFFGGTLLGHVLVSDLYTQETSVSNLFARVGLVLQNADAQLFNSTVEDEIAFGLESLGLPGKEINDRIQGISDRLNLENLLGQSPATLSGGEKRLAAVASVLCLDPEVLLLDEPYGDLDWAAVSRVRQALQDINRSGRTLIVIEQRMGDFLLDSTRCLILDRGKFLFESPSNTGGARFCREHLLPHYPRKARTRTQTNTPVLILEDLSYGIDGKEILSSVSLELRTGETAAIIGRNGAGKTTLIKQFNGLLRPSDGKVIFNGEQLGDKDPSEMAAKIGLSFQNPNDQFFKSRVKDEILVGPSMLKQVEDEWVEEIWSIFGLHGLLERPPYRLSEGEKKRVALASILAMQPTLLVLDEPTSGQDGRFREALALLLAELQDRGFTTVMATHDLDFAKATADRWIVLHEGRVVADGGPEEILRNEELFRMGALGPSEADAPTLTTRK